MACYKVEPRNVPNLQDFLISRGPKVLEDKKIEKKIYFYFQKNFEKFFEKKMKNFFEKKTDLCTNT